LVKVERNINTKGQAETYEFTLDLTVIARFSGDPYPTWSYNTTVYQGKFNVQVLDRACTREEELRIGNEVIVATSYEETDYGSDGFTWIPGGWPGLGTVSSTWVYGVPPGGLYFSNTVSMSGGISSSLSKYNASVMTYTYYPPPGSYLMTPSPAPYAIQIGGKQEATKIGSRNLHVTAFDNYDGANNYILMYKKDTLYYRSTNEWSNVNDGTAPVYTTTTVNDDTETTHYIAYKIKDKSIVKSSKVGDYRVHSCQIHNGIMAYTYGVYTNSIFNHRVVGIINMTTGASKELELDDKDIRLDDFAHVHHAAIGLM
jgi:hypothetical protein